MKANHGLIAMKKKPVHVIEGENAKAYIEHTINKSEEFAETHKQMQDELEKEKIAERKREKEAFENDPKNAQHQPEGKPAKTKLTKSKVSGSDSESESSDSESSDDESTQKKPTAHS